MTLVTEKNSSLTQSIHLLCKIYEKINSVAQQHLRNVFPSKSVKAARGDGKKFTSTSIISDKKRALVGGRFMIEAINSRATFPPLDSYIARASLRQIWFSLARFK
jgi:hypothetical protein